MCGYLCGLGRVECYLHLAQELDQLLGLFGCAFALVQRSLLLELSVLQEERGGEMGSGMSGGTGNQAALSSSFGLSRGFQEREFVFLSILFSSFFFLHWGLVLLCMYEVGLWRDRIPGIQWYTAEALDRLIDCLIVTRQMTPTGSIRGLIDIPNISKAEGTR